MRSGFKSCALEPLLTGLCIYDANYCIHIKMYIVASQRGISPMVNIPTPCAWQASLSIFGWGMRSGFNEKAHWAASLRLHNYDARCCIIIMERYRSGHNGADSKSVCANAHEGSNPSLSANKREASSFEGAFLFFCENIKGIRTVTEDFCTT